MSKLEHLLVIEVRNIKYRDILRHVHYIQCYKFRNIRLKIIFHKLTFIVTVYLDSNFIRQSSMQLKLYGKIAPFQYLITK